MWIQNCTIPRRASRTGMVELLKDSIQYALCAEIWAHYEAVAMRWRMAGRRSATRSQPMLARTQQIANLNVLASHKTHAPGKLSVAETLSIFIYSKFISRAPEK